MIGIEEFKSDGGEGREWQWSRADCKRVLVAAEWTVEGAGQKQRDPLGGCCSSHGEGGGLIMARCVGSSSGDRMFLAWEIGGKQWFCPVEDKE